MKMKKGSEEKTQKKKDGKNETSGRKDKQGEYFFLTILAKFITNQR